jgi:hypothetical protein
MVLIVINPGTGINDASVMAGKTHSRICHNFVRLEWDKIRAPSVQKKGVYPAIVTNCTFLRRVGVPRDLNGRKGYARMKSKELKEENEK